MEKLISSIHGQRIFSSPVWGAVCEGVALGVPLGIAVAVGVGVGSPVGVGSGSPGVGSGSSGAGVGVGSISGVGSGVAVGSISGVSFDLEFINAASAVSSTNIAPSLPVADVV